MADDLSNLNVKTATASSKGVPLKLFYLNLSKRDNPFQEQIQDTDELKRMFRDRPFIPYSGTNQNPENNLLYVLKLLSELSPTQNTVLNSMGFYCFGGRLGLIEAIDPEFDAEVEYLEGPSTKQIFEALKAIKPIGGFSNLAKNLFKSRKYSGESYILLRFYQVAGQRRATINHLDNLKVMPMITDLGKPEMFITFQEWNEKTLSEKKYELIGKYPFITQAKDGGYATIIQYKNGNGWRGRPVETGIMIDQYREYKDNLFLTRQAANNFTPQIIIEYTESDPAFTDKEERDAIAQGFTGLQDRLQKNVTMDGDDPMSVLWLTRPPDASPLTVHEVSQNTNEKWFDKTGGITTTRILAAHSWPRDFLDSEMAVGFSQSAHFDKLIVKLPFIEAQASIEEGVINQAIDAAMQWLGLEGMMDGVDVKFKNPYQTLLDSYQEAKNQTPGVKDAQGQTNKVEDQLEPEEEDEEDETED